MHSLFWHLRWSALFSYYFIYFYCKRKYFLRLGLAEQIPSVPGETVRFFLRFRYWTGTVAFLRCWPRRMTICRNLHRCARRRNKNNNMSTIQSRNGRRRSTTATTAIEFASWWIETTRRPKVANSSKRQSTVTGGLLSGNLAKKVRLGRTPCGAAIVRTFSIYPSSQISFGFVSIAWLHSMFG